MVKKKHAKIGLKFEKQILNLDQLSVHEEGNIHDLNFQFRLKPKDKRGSC